MNKMILTGKEIKDLAEFVGLIVDKPMDPDILETEVCIQKCPAEGVHDDDKPRHYRLIASLYEYPEEGCVGLGDEL